MSSTAIANGNRLHILENQSSTERETLARRFAADIGRDHDAVDRIMPGVGGTVDVWLVDSGDDYADIAPPDGWCLVSVGVASIGSACLEFKREADI